MTAEMFYVLSGGRALAGSEVHHGAWMAKRKARNMWVSFDETPRSRGHAFPRLPVAGVRAGVRPCFAEKICTPYHTTRGRPSIPPGRSSRSPAGYFDGIDSERGGEWRCADSFSQREFLLLDTRESVPDHTLLPRSRYGCSLMMSTSRCLPSCSMY